MYRNTKEATIDKIDYNEQELDEKSSTATLRTLRRLHWDIIDKYIFN